MRRLNVYVDTEFNGFNGSLISIALVSDEGHEFYEVLPFPAQLDPWVAENVIPVLGQAPLPDYHEFTHRLHRFINQLRGRAVIFVADWYTDLAWLFGSFAGRDHADSLDFPCQAAIRPIPYVSEVPHNALEDARAMKRAARQL